MRVGRGMIYLTVFVAEKKGERACHPLSQKEMDFRLTSKLDQKQLLSLLGEDYLTMSLIF